MPTPQPPFRELFTYGSLMCADIMTFVAGVALASTPATLPGFRRFRVRDEHYPGVVADAAAMVAGLVYHHLAPDCWTRLDAFEGEMYERRPVTVLLANGTQTQVNCYIFRPEFHHRLTTEAWDYAAFLQDGKKEFQRRYCGFRAIAANPTGRAGSPSPVKMADNPKKKLTTEQGDPGNSKLPAPLFPGKELPCA